MKTNHKNKLSKEEKLKINMKSIRINGAIKPLKRKYKHYKKIL